VIREATLEDVEMIARFEQEVFPDNCLNELSIEKELGAGRTWVAEDQAYALTRWDEDVIDLLRLGVLPPYQRQGLGRVLLRTVLHHADRPVILTVRRNNAPALRLYRQEGFRPAGYLPDADALLMRFTSTST